MSAQGRLLPRLTRTRLAGAVLYLVSGAASYTTGVALNVDGGFLVT
jgi:NAD(P)-dependent dehydrogenase (short-subunit alcohol dehydrogenase family)